MKDFIPCGILKEGIDFSQIVCDPTTGDMIFCDDINGNCIMSNLGLTDPIFADKDAMMNIINQYNLDGVIMTDSYVIFLKDYVATFRSYIEPDSVKMTTTFDLDIQYEGYID